MSKVKKCLLCENDVNVNINFNTGVNDVLCGICGSYKISGDAFDDLPHDLDKDPKLKSMLSGAIKELTDKNIEFGLITSKNYLDILEYVNIPENPIEKMDKILAHLYRNTEYLYQKIEIDFNNYSIAYAVHKEEFENLIIALGELGYIKNDAEDDDDIQEIYLSLEGIEKSKDKIDHEENKQCFVAMWFSDDMMKIFKDTISRAVESTGFKPIIIPMKEYNDDINDQIIAEIKKSNFIIADFTGHRGGVYYEAGYAAGMGKPVIYTCHEAWFNSTTEKEITIKTEDGTDISGKVKEVRDIHFDLNHKNFIIWNDEKELYERIYNRILATIVKT